MKEKTNEPKPLVRIEHAENHYTEIYVLDEGDRMAWNTSTNYDHHMMGPSLVTKTVNRGHQITEYHVNDPEGWLWIHRMMRLGKKWLDENPEFDTWEFDKKLKQEMENYSPHVSHHKS